MIAATYSAMSSFGKSGAGTIVHQVIALGLLAIAMILLFLVVALAVIDSKKNKAIIKREK